MMGKDIDPSDIGKHPKIIRIAQNEMTQTDVLVCGKCHCVFHFIELFKEHKEDGCNKDTSLKDSRETKPKVWAFLLWKASQLNNEGSTNINSWKLYQTWVKMEESVRETWVVAGKTIQSFARMGQGSLQEMPVKITKTVVDSTTPSPSSTKPATIAQNKLTQPRPTEKNESRPLKRDVQTTDNEDEVSPIKVDPPKIIKKVIPAVVQAPKVVASTPIVVNKNMNRRAQRTIPNTSSQEFEEETVEKIIAKRFNPRRKMHEYLVKWDGFPHDQNTWEPQTHLESCPQLLETFEKQLARQKEQRAAQAAKQTAVSQLQQQQQQQTAVKTEIVSPGRPARNSKAKALDQVKQWCADEETNSVSGSVSGGIKRKHEDSDFDESGAGGEDEDDEFDEDELSQPTKKLKNGNLVSAAVAKMETKSDLKISQVPKVIRAVNGHFKSTLNDSLAEVVITKDTQTSGVVKKTGVSPSTTSHKNEAQIRVLSKGENTTSGVVRITTTTSSQLVSGGSSGSNQKMSNPSAPTKGTIGTSGTTVQTPRITQVSRTNTSIGTTTINQQKRPISSSMVGGTRIIPTTQTKTSVTKQTMQRTSVSPNVNPQQQSTFSNAGKTVVSRVMKNPAQISKPTVTPEQKIIQLSKSGDLKVTRKVINPGAQQQQQQQQQQVITSHKLNSQEESSQQQHDLNLADESFTEPHSPPRPLTLCPVTGKVLGEAENEPVQQHTEVEKKEPDTSSNVSSQNQQQADHQSQAIVSDLSEGLTLAGDDGQTQQLLANEDGTPLLVTGEDGTIYQVAGKNAEGQTILIAQGADGEQQFAYVAAEEGEEGGVLTLDNAVAEAVAQMLPEQQAEALAAAAAAAGSGETQFIIKSNDDNATANTNAAAGGGDATQALSIQTGDSGDSQDANIPAEVVQADLPSPGGTRRVVLLLQDGTFMMTEMHDDEYQALNIVS